MPPLWALHAIPFFLLGLILTYLLAFQIPLLPIFGGYSPGAAPSFNWRFVWDVFQHALLPALSIILVATGGWALGMRGMMVTTMGEDYVVFAEAKGLKAPTVFLRYCLRNAILPQVTALALALGQILSGAVLVEVIFGYPGIGTLLFQAIRENDHFVIQACSLSSSWRSASPLSARCGSSPSTPFRIAGRDVQRCWRNLALLRRNRRTAGRRWLAAFVRDRPGVDIEDAPTVGRHCGRHPGTIRSARTGRAATCWR